MKSFVRELIGDFKAAVRIGDPDSLEAVMDRVRAAPEDELPATALTPLGETVRSLPEEILLPWLDDEDAAVRGIAAAGIGWKYGAAGEIPEAAYLLAAGDPAEEVRTALVDGLTAGPGSPAAWVNILLSGDSLFARQTGLLLLGRTGSLTIHSLDVLSDFDREQDHELRTALVETLNRLAENGRTGSVLDLLEVWAGREEPNTWVVTRVVSAGWASEHSERCVTILEKLSEQVGDNRSIARALERHRTSAS